MWTAEFDLSRRHANRFLLFIWLYLITWNVLGIVGYRVWVEPGSLCRAGRFLDSFIQSSLKSSLPAPSPHPRFALAPLVQPNLLRQAHLCRRPRRPPRRRIQRLRPPHPRRQRQARFPHEARRPLGPTCQAAPRKGCLVLPSPPQRRTETQERSGVHRGFGYRGAVADGGEKGRAGHSGIDGQECAEAVGTKEGEQDQEDVCE